jgi:hypothetical protein
VLRLLDQNWEFFYVKSRPLVHSLLEFDEIASFLDCYMYVVTGCFLDSYEQLAGTPMFLKAADVVQLGRARGQRDWQVHAGKYSRAGFIEELLSPANKPARRAIWRYNAAGLDSLAIDRLRAQRNIVRALETFEKAKQQSTETNLLMRAFFDTNYQEIAAVLADYPDPAVFKRLSRLDPAHQST